MALDYFTRPKNYARSYALLRRMNVQVFGYGDVSDMTEDAKNEAEVENDHPSEYDKFYIHSEDD